MGSGRGQYFKNSQNFPKPVPENMTIMLNDIDTSVTATTLNINLH